MFSIYFKAFKVLVLFNKDFNKDRYKTLKISNNFSSGNLLIKLPVH